MKIWDKCDVDDWRLLGNFEWWLLLIDSGDSGNWLGRQVFAIETGKGQMVELRHHSAWAVRLRL